MVTGPKAGATRLAPMQFLMNDAVLELDLATLLDGESARLRALSLSGVLALGREMFAGEPLTHRAAPERARRLAALIVAKAPDVNAALFLAPEKGCRPAEVVTRFAAVEIGAMARLVVKQSAGDLTPVAADREVWRRLAA